MEYIKKVFINGKHYYYVYKRITKNGKNCDKFVRNATIEEIKTFRSSKSREDNLTIMVCDNPNCETIFKVTKQEKILFNLIEPRDKKKLQFQYCSTKCQEEHGQELRNK